MPLHGEYAPSPSQRARDQVELYERTAGAEGDTLQGRPVVILTSRGAKTGKLRKTPLMRVEHEGRYAVVASKGGAPEHPVWYHNLVAEPRVELQDGAQKWDMTAREVHGEERRQWWERAVAAFSPYADYQQRTDREIPVFVLEPGDVDPRIGHTGRMTKVSIDALAREQLKAAALAPSRRAAETVVGGHEKVLRQTVAAFLAGARIGERENHDEATIYVMSGRVELEAGGVSWRARTGNILVVPHGRHSLTALEDSTLLITIAKLP